MTVNEVILAFLRHCLDCYKDLPAEHDSVKLAVRSLRTLYGRSAAAAFGPSPCRPPWPKWPRRLRAGRPTSGQNSTRERRGRRGRAVGHGGLAGRAKSAAAHAPVVLVDETGLFLNPVVRRPRAARGEVPVIAGVCRRPRSGCRRTPRN